MATFDIWAEGFRATGEHGTATFLGTAEGKNFKEACKAFMKDHPELNKYFDSTRNTYWACDLYDNEQDARRKFG